MVTARDASGEQILFKQKFAEYIERFGRNDVSWISTTQTTNAAGRLKTSTLATVTISGDLQFMSYKERQYLGEGVANVGDGMFFTYASYGVAINDEIIIDGVYWKLTNQIEAELVGDETIYKGFVAVRKET